MEARRRGEGHVKRWIMWFGACQLKTHVVNGGRSADIGDNVYISGHPVLPYVVVLYVDDQVVIEEEGSTAKEHHPQLAKQCHQHEHLKQRERNED